MKPIVLKGKFTTKSGETFERKIEVGFCYTDGDWNDLYADDFGSVAKKNRGRAAYDCWCEDLEWGCGPEFSGKGKVMDRALTAAEKKEFEKRILQDEFFAKGWTLVA